MTDEPKISDAEVAFFITYFGSHPEPDSHSFSVTRQALAAFLKARMPQYTDGYEGGSPYDRGFNACRAAVLNGRADGK